MDESSPAADGSMTASAPPRGDRVLILHTKRGPRVTTELECAANTTAACKCLMDAARDSRGEP